MSKIRNALEFVREKNAKTGAAMRSREISDRKWRKRLKKKWRVKGARKSARPGLKRAIDNVVRKGRKYSNDHHTLTDAESLLILRGRRSSKLLDHLYPNRQKDTVWLKLRDRNFDVDKEPACVDLDKFSFLDRPRKTLGGLVSIAKAEARDPIAKINFNDKYCLDVAPYMLLVDCWNDMLPIFEGGNMEIPMQKVLAAIGVEYALDISFRGIEDFKDVWAFPLNRRRQRGETRSKKKHIDVQTREGACDRFCDAMDEWLGQPEFGLQLSTKGTGWIKDLLGELLENAERHADGERGDGSWSVSGFMARREEDAKDYFVVQIGIISLGDTFVESMERAGIRQKADISGYIENMRKLRAPQSKETLITLAALQDGVTCDPEADNAGRGGTGLMEMLDLINFLGDTPIPEYQPKVTIISGSACIQLHSPYVKGQQMSGADAARVQWCNKENSDKIAPDSMYVYDLDNSLPGTSISIRFRLDPEYLSRIKNGGNSDAD